MTLVPNVIANERTYSMPKRCAIAICLDGCEPEYLDVAIAEGLMPNLKLMRETGTDRIAHSVIPSFTNPNNLSIATGRPPAIHGICGNYLFDPDTGEEVMMNDVRFLRAPTIFSKFYEAGFFNLLNVEGLTYGFARGVDFVKFIISNHFH